MDNFNRQDESYMREALALAKNGEGRVSPNPPVGCVLVKGGRIIARGWHNRLGGLHAEAMALAEAGGDARDATAYVTLSPCTTHGRQPPCADALIRAGIGEVVIAAPDPNLRNADGAQVLRAAGIPVRVGLLRDDAEFLARGFMKVQRTGLPWVIFKYAMTLDGKIAAASGDSRWVSGPESRELVQDMRSRSDAILVGSGTVLADDPLLTVRGPALTARGGPETHRQPLRVVVDGRCRMPATAAMLDPTRDGGGEVVVFSLPEGTADKRRELAAKGAIVVELVSDSGKVPLREMLRNLAGRGVNVVFCEGGGGLAGALFADGLVDEVVAFIAPKIVGGLAAPGPVGGEGVGLMADARPITVLEWRRVGGDIVVTGLAQEKNLAHDKHNNV